MPTYLNLLTNSDLGLIDNIIRYQIFFFQTCDDLGFTFSEQEWSELRRHLSIDQVKSLLYDVLTNSDISTDDISTNDISTNDISTNEISTNDILTKDVLLKSLFYDILTTSDISTKYVSLIDCFV